MAINLDELIDSLTGIEASDILIIDVEINDTKRRLVLLEKLRSMAPSTQLALPGPEAMKPEKNLKRLKHQKIKHTSDAARTGRPALPDHDDPILKPGNLMTPEERRKKIAELVNSNGPMNAGALAKSMKCDTDKVYNVLYLEPGKSLFNRSGNGVELTAKGRAELLS